MTFFIIYIWAWELEVRNKMHYTFCFTENIVYIFRVVGQETKFQNTGRRWKLLWYNNNYNIMDDFDELILEEELFAPPSEIVDYSLELLANIIYYIAYMLHKNKWLLNHRSEWYSKKILNINFCFWWYSSVFGWNKITPELVRIAWGLTCYHHAVSLWTYGVAYWFSLLLALEN